MAIVITFVVAFFIIVYIYLKINAMRINDYYKDAVTLYLFEGHEDAKLAAITASKIAAKNQRMFLVDYTIDLSYDLARIHNKKQRYKLVDRASEISEAIIEKEEWTLSDIVDAKSELKQVNEDYLKAVEKVDPKIFRRKYPEVFEKSMEKYRLEVL